MGSLTKIIVATGAGLCVSGLFLLRFGFPIIAVGAGLITFGTVLYLIGQRK